MQASSDCPREQPAPDPLRIRRELAVGAARYLEDLEARRVGGLALNDLQKLAAIGFHEWVRRHDAEEQLLGHILMPMASGKTAVAAMLGDMTDRTTLFLADNATTASQAVEFFTFHESLKPQERRVQVGRCFGKDRDVHAQRVVGGFASVHAWWDELDWAQVGLLIIDEADVNALSEKRYARLLQAASLGIPIVAMSATEQQASGKNLRAYFPQEILHEPVPGALHACLDAGIIAPTVFSDVYFDITLPIAQDALRTRNDLPDVKVRDLLRSTAWNALLLNDYERDFRREDGTLSPALVIFRDNLLVDDFVQQAADRGVRAAALTGDDDAVQQTLVREQYRRGELDMLVGSRLLGRGFNAPEARVVYNSTITFSGQIFWQASGRALRRDPDDPAKVAHVRTVLPGRVVDETTGQELGHAGRPLSHASFFDPAFFVPDTHRAAVQGPRPRGHRGTRPGIRHFDLAQIGTARTIDEVETVLHSFWRYGGSFTSRPEFLAAFIENVEQTELTRTAIGRILRMRNTDLRAAGNALDDSPRPQDLLDARWGKWASERGVGLNASDERALLLRYAAGKDAVSAELQEDALRARDELLQAHMPLILALARKLSHGVDQQDLVQEGTLRFFAALKTFDLGIARKARFATYALTGIADGMQRHAVAMQTPYRIPEGVRERRRSANGEPPSWEDAVFARRHIPLQAMAGFEDGELLTMEAVIPSPVEDPGELALQKDLTRTVNAALAALSPREEMIIRMRYGVNAPGVDMTFADVAEHILMSRERIRQIDSQALSKLRRVARDEPGFEMHHVSGTRGTAGTDLYAQDDPRILRSQREAHERRAAFARILSAPGSFAGVEAVRRIGRLGATAEEYIELGDASMRFDSTTARHAYVAAQSAERLNALAQYELKVGRPGRAVHCLRDAEGFGSSADPVAEVHAYGEKLLRNGQISLARRAYKATGIRIPADTARSIAEELLLRGACIDAIKIYAHLGEAPEAGVLRECQERLPATPTREQAALDRYLRKREGS